jgi:hypothetical protein
VSETERSKKTVNREEREIKENRFIEEGNKKNS